MHISYKPLWHTLIERNMRKEDLRLAAGLTTNMIANMGKGKHISMETLTKICEAAHLNYLIAYYLFTALTPPASDILAKHYIKSAIDLNPLPRYMVEAAFIENGN